MEFTLPAGALARVVGLVKGCVPGKTTLPVLSHVLIEAKAAEIMVRATNFDMECEARVPAEVKIEGSAAIPGDVLHGIVKRLVKSDEAGLTLGSGRVTLVSGRSQYVLRALPPDEFPVFKPLAPDGAAFTVDASALAGLIESTIYAVSTDETRVYLNGIYLHVADDRLAAMAADGHRMALREMPVPAGAEAMPGIIVPTTAAREILSLLGEVGGTAEIKVDDSKIRVEMPGVSFASRLIDGTFPPQARDKFPARNGAAFTVKPRLLVEAVERAILVYSGTDTKAPGAKLVGGLRGIDLTAGLAGHDMATEDVEAIVHQRGAEVRVNVRYLAEMLKLWGDVDLDVQASEVPGGPVLFSSAEVPEVRHIIMPQTR